MWPRTWEALGRKAPPVSFRGSSAWTVDCRPKTLRLKLQCLKPCPCPVLRPPQDTLQSEGSDAAVSTLQRTGIVGT